MSGLECVSPVSAVECTDESGERTDTLTSETLANRTFCFSTFKSLTQPEPVYRPRASSARCACQHTPKACTLTIISWYLRGPVARVSGWRSRAHV